MNDVSSSKDELKADLRSHPSQFRVGCWNPELWITGCWIPKFPAATSTRACSNRLMIAYTTLEVSIGSVVKGNLVKMFVRKIDYQLRSNLMYIDDGALFIFSGADVIRGLGFECVLCARFSGDCSYGNYVWPEGVLCSNSKEPAICNETSDLGALWDRNRGSLLTFWWIFPTMVCFNTKPAFCLSRTWRLHPLGTILWSCQRPDCAFSIALPKLNVCVWTRGDICALCETRRGGCAIDSEVLVGYFECGAWLSVARDYRWFPVYVGKNFFAERRFWWILKQVVVLRGVRLVDNPNAILSCHAEGRKHSSSGLPEIYADKGRAYSRDKYLCWWRISGHKRVILIQNN